MLMPRNISTMLFTMLITFARANSTMAAAPINRIPMQNQNLPENYDYEFFHRHLSIWPELSLIAENGNKELIGYTLGKAEEIVPRFPSVPMSSFADMSSDGKQKNGFGFQQSVKKHYDPKYCGHVTSLAVFKEYRHSGIAKELMNRLHEEMVRHYSIDTVSLHCRVGNLAAIRLYSDNFNYQCSNLINNYYDDNEDAWVMNRFGLLKSYKKTVLSGKSYS